MKIESKVDKLNRAGNKLLYQHQYTDAVQMFTQTINLAEKHHLPPTTLAVLYSNRALASLRLEDYQAALDDSAYAIDLDEDFVKAYYRRGTAHLALRHFADSLSDFRKLVYLAPDSELAKERLRMCQASYSEYLLVTSMTNGTECQVDIPDWRDIPYPDHYSGPRLDDDEIVTDQFILELISYGKLFMEQHRKQIALQCYPQRLVLQLLERGAFLFSQEPTVIDLHPPTPNNTPILSSINSPPPSASASFPLHPTFSQATLQAATPTASRTPGRNGPRQLIHAYPSPAMSPPASHLHVNQSLDYRDSQAVYPMQINKEGKSIPMLTTKVEHTGTSPTQSVEYKGGSEDPEKGGETSGMMKDPADPNASQNLEDEMKDDSSSALSSSTDSDDDVEDQPDTQWHTVTSRQSRWGQFVAQENSQKKQMKERTHRFSDGHSKGEEDDEENLNEMTGLEKPIKRVHLSVDSLSSSLSSCSIQAQSLSPPPIEVERSSMSSLFQTRHVSLDDVALRRRQVRKYEKTRRLDNSTQVTSLRVRSKPKQKPSATKQQTEELRRQKRKEAAKQSLQLVDNAFALLLDDVDVDSTPIVLTSHLVSFELPDLYVGIDDHETLRKLQDEYEAEENAAHNASTPPPISSPSISSPGVFRTFRSALPAASFPPAPSSPFHPSRVLLPPTPLAHSTLGLNDNEPNHDGSRELRLTGVFDVNEMGLMEQTRVRCGSFNMRMWEELELKEKKKQKRERKEQRRLERMKKRNEAEDVAMPPPSAPIQPSQDAQGISTTHFGRFGVSHNDEQVPQPLDAKPAEWSDKQDEMFNTFSHGFEPLRATPTQMSDQPAITRPSPTFLSAQLEEEESDEVPYHLQVRTSILNQSSHVSFVEHSSNDSPPLTTTRPWRCTVVGDLHGQFEDFCRLIETTSLPSSSHAIVFLGDYVDRGLFGVEILTVLLALKIAHPNSTILLRGNHEATELNTLFGFAKEVREKYTVQTYIGFTRLFASLPLCCIIKNKVLCVHGGIPPPPSFILPEPSLRDGDNWAYAQPMNAEDYSESTPVRNPLTDMPLFYRNPPSLYPLQMRVSLSVYNNLSASEKVVRDPDGSIPANLSCKSLLDEMRKITRSGHTLASDITTMMLWSDPSDFDGLALSERGSGFLFGPDVSKQFCEETGIDLIVRSHQLKMNGWEYQHRSDCSCLTVFSAPNYCGNARNRGAWAELTFGDSVDVVNQKVREARRVNVMDVVKSDSDHDDDDEPVSVIDNNPSAFYSAPSIFGPFRQNAHVKVQKNGFHVEIKEYSAVKASDLFQGLF
ncbi:putative Serine/threonine-protein phosphatase PP2A catalytic subunit [Blattamonas nauphoetae]|uniref:Serine/threonine-protein phosphatase n=1 Tax=Blattamonas nauphoetae TaxID=2049346 RepID=A0ABQ9XI17_9EUKA|nr:putative Serine/threonine-protein phosphatase PP2A catalytic subunit [Blattamonas nauphoetae]